MTTIGDAVYLAVIIPIILLGLTVAAAIIFGVVLFRNGEPAGDCIGMVAFTSLVGVLVGVLLCGAITGIGNISTDHRDDYVVLGLEAIRDGSSISGAFVLGTGILGSDPSYTFYDNDHGAIHLDKVGASDIALYEDSAKPYVIEYTGCHLKPSWLAPCFDDGPRVTEIHVPPGSVKNQINLNLNGN